MELNVGNVVWLESNGDPNRSGTTGYYTVQSCGTGPLQYRNYGVTFLGDSYKINVCSICGDYYK